MTERMGANGQPIKKKVTTIDDLPQEEVVVEPTVEEVIEEVADELDDEYDEDILSDEEEE